MTRDAQFTRGLRVRSWRNHCGERKATGGARSPGVPTAAHRIVRITSAGRRLYRRLAARRNRRNRRNRLLHGRSRFDLGSVLGGLLLLFYAVLEFEHLSVLLVELPLHFGACRAVLVDQRLERVRAIVGAG